MPAAIPKALLEDIAALEECEPLTHDQVIAWGACRGVDPTLWFPEGDPHIQLQAKAICSDCLVRIPCLNLATSTRARWASDGIWGGRSAEERKTIGNKRRALARSA